MKLVINAYLDNNLGDDLMVKLLAKRFPYIHFYLHTNSSTIKNSFQAIDNIIIKSTKNKKDDIQKADAYVTIGGSRFQLVSLKQKFWRIKRLRQLKRVKKRNLKIATLGSNFGPYSGKIGVKLTEWELRMNDLVTVRDSEAENLLNSFKKVTNFHFADDIVYTLEAIYERQNPKKSGLGISAYRSIRNPIYNYPNYQFLAALADEYIKRTDKSVTLFAFDSENENDLAAAFHIFNLATEKKNIEIIPYLGDEKRFLEQFESCERMIAIRFHSAILADIFEIPFLPVVYSNKMNNLLHDRGYKGLSFELKDFNSDLAVDKIVDTIITGDDIFIDFTGNRHNANIHFNELEKILSMK